MQNLDTAIAPFPQDHDSFYFELTRRNHAFVPAEVQQRLRSLKILVAGCGSIGGACIESLARLGIENFALADNGAYELNNLNRQHALLEDLGKNKAEFHAQTLKKINPFINVETAPQGITSQNAGPLTQWADLVVDGVDVTTPSGISAKIGLHFHAKRAGKPVFVALDLGFCQYGKAYDYRNTILDTLGGKFDELKAVQNPLKALLMIVPPSAIPAHCLDHIKDLLLDPNLPASQLGATSDLLASIIVSAVIRFAADEVVIPGWYLDLETLARPLSQVLFARIRGLRVRRQIARIMKTLP